MPGPCVQHGGVCPAGGALAGYGAGNGFVPGDQRVDLVRPGTGNHHAFLDEILHLRVGILPVALDQRVLRTQQTKRRRVLRLVELEGILDAQRTFVRHQVQGRIGDVDRAVVGLHASAGGFAVWKFSALEHD